MALGFSFRQQYTVNMMHTVNLLELNMESEGAVELVISRLAKEGLQAKRTFDFQIARAAHADCTCPHHGTNQCDCQMIVLLVYGKGNWPATLVVHSHHGRSQILLVNTPDLHPRNELVRTTQLAVGSLYTNSVEGWKYAT
jgi:hypothetical protein